jgi:hypothetical protein
LTKIQSETNTLVSSQESRNAEPGGYKQSGNINSDVHNVTKELTRKKPLFYDLEVIFGGRGAQHW